jgi:sphingolipid delta-4 desaturase
MNEGRFHRERRYEILRTRPNVRHLFGNHPQTATIAALVVCGQLTMAYLISERPWWFAAAAAYFIGAFLIHFLNVVVHECTHNLVFRKSRWNKALGILLNLPALAPGAIAFRHYHLLHHHYLGIPCMDADVAPRWEVRLVGRSAIGKFLWFAAQPLTYTVLHPLRVRERIRLDGWLAANIALVLAAGFATAHWLGANSVVYLLLSSYFAIGPHPAGAHVLQEHFIFEGDDETFSYYGAMNAISLNHGLHLEHHDFPNIPGANLGKVRLLAPKFYDRPYQHRSRWATIWRFVTDPHVRLDSRAIADVSPER